MDAERKEQLRSAAQKGAALLDGNYAGWALMLRNKQLDMESCFQCVLGHLYGEFVLGKHALFGRGVAPGVVLSYGFDVEETDHLVEDYEFLEHAWNEEIATRTKVLV